ASRRSRSRSRPARPVAASSTSLRRSRRVAPVARRIDVAHRDHFLKTELNARDRVRHLAGDELQAALRAFVIEQDPAARVDAVRLSIVERRVVTEYLRDAVRRTRMERRRLGLRRLLHL